MFRNPIYIYISKEKRKKLEPSNLKGILVGDNDSFKAYKVYVPSRRKRIVIQDVNVDEDASLAKVEPVGVRTVDVPIVDPQKSLSVDSDQPSSSTSTTIVIVSF